jgi:hypothetical protein
MLIERLREIEKETPAFDATPALFMKRFDLEKPTVS